MYWDLQFGYLQVWIYADSPDDAADRVWHIVEQLPYERVGTLVSVHLDKQPVIPEFEAGERMASSLGIGLFFGACVTGVDEGNFEAETPL